MKIALSTTAPSQIDTECLVVTVLDKGEKDPVPEVQSSDAAVRKAAEDLIGSKEVTGKLFESVLLHRPQGLKAKRVLFVGGGKAKNFSSIELRKVAGTAARFLKSKTLRSFAFAAPESWTGKADPSAQSTTAFERGGMQDALKSITEGAIAGDFDPDYYKSDRKDLKLSDLTVVVPASADAKGLEQA